MCKIERIQLFGERSSGTNYLQQLLFVNILDIKFTTQYGWKHFFPTENLADSDNCLFIVIYRNPFDWLRSLYLQPHHVHDSLKGLDFSEFIRKEWHCVWDELADVFPNDENYGQEMMFERDKLTGCRFNNVIKLRAAKIMSFESLSGKVKYIEFIRYEDLVKESKQIVSQIAKKYHLHLAAEFSSIEKYKGITDEDFVPKKYFDIKRSDSSFIIAQLNHKLEKSIGYSTSYFHEKNFAVIINNFLKNIFIRIKSAIIK